MIKALVVLSLVAAAWASAGQFSGIYPGYAGAGYNAPGAYAGYPGYTGYPGALGLGYGGVHAPYHGVGYPGYAGAPAVAPYAGYNGIYNGYRGVAPGLGYTARPYYK